MRQENQASIVQWADETFGPATSVARVVVRAYEEFVELLRAHTSGKPLVDVCMEAADVTIVLFRAAEMRQADLLAEAYEARKCLSNGNPLEVAHGHMTMLVRSVVWSDPDIWPMAHEMGSIVAALGRFVDERHVNVGLSLRELVNRKMEINRARQWRTDGTGHGYHTRVDGEAAIPLHQFARG